MKNFGGFVAFLSSEFHRYLMENEAQEQHIPPNALIIFDVAGEAAFNRWHRQTSLKNREAGQPIVQVHVGSLRRHAAIEDVHLAGVPA